MISSMSWCVPVGQDDGVMDGHGDKVEGVCSIPIPVPCELLSQVSSKLSPLVSHSVFPSEVNYVTCVRCYTTMSE